MTSEQDQANPPPDKETLCITFLVDPARLAWGDYDHAKERKVGEGDIHGAYSGDTIALQSKVRNPFRWEGSLWTTVGTGGGGPRGIEHTEAYRLVPIKLFAGTPTTYHDKTGTAEGAEAARNDLNGFYHGMTVKHGKETYVMVGPPGIFIAAPDRPDAAPQPQQMDLFA